MSRRQQRTITLLLAALSALTSLGPAPVRAADATMTFNSVLNVVGVLSAITVGPTAVTVPAGGEVLFVNATAVVLRVTVGGESTRVEPGGSASMLFTGTTRAETFTAVASAANVPLVGALTSSAGRVTVLAASPDEAEPRSTSGPDSADQRRSESPGPDDGSAPSGPAGATPSTRSGAVIPLAPSSSASVHPSSSPSPTGPSEDRGRDDADDAVTPEGERPGSPDLDPADAEVSPVLPPFPGFSSTHDQLGLVVLLTAVVIAGLGAAAFRTVLAYRPVVEVGAHSQAARKARTLRRKRG
ncbi:hypothetical protein [Cryptosporangium aurantiacum]|uniref:FecR family protein n=1 Tax=Cryptosporangium aurantiacum TaxID=134849 RepID=A0A1M7RKL8_9ACTN|nr:hypothetical protein [Cryptosporangium aurantiacum]SHN46863.1 hypothetical protein SAMN05443668_11896 [Cryptosporangium aurantiacum]